MNGLVKNRWTGMMRNRRKVTAAILAAASISFVVAGLLTGSNSAVLAGLSLGLALVTFVLLTMLGRLNAVYVHQREVVLHDVLPGLRAEADRQKVLIEKLTSAVSEIQLAVDRSQEFQRQHYPAVGDALKNTMDLVKTVLSDASAAEDREAAARQRLVTEVEIIRAGVAAQLEAMVSGLELASQVATDFTRGVNESVDLLDERAEQLSGQLDQNVTLIASKLEEAVRSANDRIGRFSDRFDEKLGAATDSFANQLLEASGKSDQLISSGIERMSAASREVMHILEAQVFSRRDALNLTNHISALTEEMQESVEQCRVVEAAVSGASNRVACLSEQLDEKLGIAGSEARESNSTLVCLIEDVRAGALKSLADVAGQLKSVIGTAQARSDVEKSRQTNELVQSMDALFQLRSSLREGSIGPLLGDWAMDPVGMLGVVDLILAYKPALVVECGSGASTLWIARALEVLGNGKITSLEHLEEYASKTTGAIERASLQARASVMLTPVEEKEIDGEIYHWYGISEVSVEPGTINVLLVDGPPGSMGPSARYPAMPLLKHFLADDALILLDDFSRPNEIQIEKRWLEENPELSVVGTVGPRTMLMKFQRSA